MVTSPMDSTDTWIKALDLPALGISKPPRAGLRTKGDLLADEMATRQNEVAQYIAKKLRRGEELDERERIYVTKPFRGMTSIPVAFGEEIGEAGEGMSMAQMQALDKIAEESPAILVRVTSLTGLRQVRGRQPTNGFTTETQHHPGAPFAHDGDSLKAGKNKGKNVNSKTIPASGFPPDFTDDDTSDIEKMYNAPIDELRGEAGSHFLWDDRIHDHFLSFSISSIFILSHAYLRHLRGQGHISISFVDRHKTKRPVGFSNRTLETKDNAPVKFYFAPDLCDIIDIYNHEFVKMKGPGVAPKARETAVKTVEQKMHYKKINHEFVAYGSLESTTFRLISWNGLYMAGIFDLIPEMRVDQDHSPAKLYTFCEHLRKTTHKTDTPCTSQHLDIAERLTRLAMKEECSRPNLWIFLFFLSLRKRGKADTLLQERMRLLGYTRADLDLCLHPNYEKVHSNLPEEATMMNLLRNVQTVVGGEPIKHNIRVSERASNNSRSKEILEKGSVEFEHIYETNLSDPVTANEKMIGYCGSPCKCPIWDKKSKRDIQDASMSSDEEGQNSKKRREGVLNRKLAQEQEQALEEEPANQKEEEEVTLQEEILTIEECEMIDEKLEKELLMRRAEAQKLAKGA